MLSLTKNVGRAAVDLQKERRELHENFDDESIYDVFGRNINFPEGILLNAPLWKNDEFTTRSFLNSFSKRVKFRDPCKSLVMVTHKHISRGRRQKLKFVNKCKEDIIIRTLGSYS